MEVSKKDFKKECDVGLDLSNHELQIVDSFLVLTAEDHFHSLVVGSQEIISIKLAELYLEDRMERDNYYKLENQGSKPNANKKCMTKQQADKKNHTWISPKLDSSYCDTCWKKERSEIMTYYPDSNEMDHHDFAEQECLENGGHVSYPGQDVLGVDKFGNSKVQCVNCHTIFYDGSGNN